MGAPHWIGSVRFELRSSDSHALDPVLSELREGQERLLVRPLQHALDLADRPSSILRRRRIEIDLGRIDAGSLESLLERRISGAIRSELGEPDKTLHEPGRGLQDQLFAFLEHGHLRWPSPGKALEAICTALAGEGHASLARLAGRLERLFRRRAEAAERFTRQCPLDLVIQIAAILAGSGEAVVAHSSGSPSYAGDEVARRLAAFILRLSYREAVRDEERQYLQSLIAGVPGAGTKPAVYGLPIVPTVPPAPDGAQLAEPPTARPAPRRDSQGHAVGDATLPEALSLEAAGTVLIYPFMAGLFGACGLLDAEGKFPGQEERCRAVLLIHYAATGEGCAAEPELALAKLLCGLDLKTPVQRSIEPSSTENTEVEAMLVAAISHWKALGDSSPEALRETFLKRMGRLIRKDRDWRLEVEPRGVDILIDRLPWAIGLVLTPFMTRPLTVDWR
jgi:hypothetical protein